MSTANFFRWEKGLRWLALTLVAASLVASVAAHSWGQTGGLSSTGSPRPAVPAGQSPETVLASRFADAALLSQRDRELVLRNWEQFRQLPPDQREAILKLHQDLEQDRGQGGRLRQVMETYGEWLKTLTPGQREDLRRQTDPTKRAALVRALRSQQVDDEHRQITATPTLDLNPFTWNTGPKINAPVILSREELDRFFNLLIADSPVKSLIEQKPTLERFRDSLEFSLQQSNEQRRWLPANRVLEFAKEIANPKLDEILRGIDQATVRRLVLARVVLASIQAEVQREFQAKLPDDGKLQEFYESLDATTRNRLMELDFAQTRRELILLYLAKYRDTDPDLKHLLEQRDMLLRVLNKLGESFRRGLEAKSRNKAS